MSRVRARRRVRERYVITLELLNALLAPDPDDAGLRRAWYAVRDRLPPVEPPEEDEALWAFAPGVPEVLRTRPEFLTAQDPAILAVETGYPPYVVREAERARQSDQAILVGRRRWLADHPEMLR